MEDNKSIFSDTYEVIDYLQSGSGGMVYKAYHKRFCLTGGIYTSFTFFHPCK